MSELHFFKIATKRQSLVFWNFNYIVNHKHGMFGITIKKSEYRNSKKKPPINLNIFKKKFSIDQVLMYPKSYDRYCSSCSWSGPEKRTRDSTSSSTASNSNTSPTIEGIPPLIYYLKIEILFKFIKLRIKDELDVNYELLRGVIKRE